MDRLYDASAFLHIVSYGSEQLLHFRGQATLDFTRYEIGNAIWRNLQNDRRYKLSLSRSCLGLLSEMDLLGVDGMEEDVADTLISTGLTFYDSAYVTVAKKYGLELITDDDDMLKAALGCGVAAAGSGTDWRH